MLQAANRMAIAGTVFLAVSITAVVYVITSVLFSTAAALAVAAGVAGLVGWLWYSLPLFRRARER
jgi:hypothetical protein